MFPCLCIIIYFICPIHSLPWIDRLHIHQLSVSFLSLENLKGGYSGHGACAGLGKKISIIGGLPIFTRFSLQSFEPCVVVNNAFKKIPTHSAPLSTNDNGQISSLIHRRFDKQNKKKKLPPGLSFDHSLYATAKQILVQPTKFTKDTSFSVQQTKLTKTVINFCFSFLLHNVKEKKRKRTKLTFMKRREDDLWESLHAQRKGIWVIYIRLWGNHVRV